MKAVAAGNYIGWPLLTVKNVNKYYPETNETSMGHLSQTRKNVRSTRPLEMSNTTMLQECVTYKNQFTTQEKPYSPTKQDNSQQGCNEVTSTSW
jgi:hypothetical protein